MKKGKEEWNGKYQQGPRKHHDHYNRGLYSYNTWKSPSRCLINSMEVVEQAKLYTHLLKRSELLVDLSNLLCLVVWSLADKSAIKGYPAHYCRKMSASVEEVSWKQRNRARIAVYEVPRNILLLINSVEVVEQANLSTRLGKGFELLVDLWN